MASDDVDTSFIYFGNYYFKYSNTKMCLESMKIANFFFLFFTSPPLPLVMFENFFLFVVLFQTA